MAKTGQGGLEAIASSLPREKRGRPPVESWNPPFCGDIDMQIDADGVWFYQKTPIGRPALVRLFASVLRREGDRHFLVTPVEKVGIDVADAPFLAVEMRVRHDWQGQVIGFRTNVDDEVEAGPDHPMKFTAEPDTGGLKPYVLVRGGLWAKVTRALFYDLADLGEEREVDGKRMFGVMSQGAFFPMAAADELRGSA